MDGISQKRRKVFAYSKGYERQLEATPGGISQIQPPQNINRNMIYGRLTKDDHIINVTQGTNDLTIRDADTNRVIKTLKGNQEQPYSK
jgi:hypothetical protein